MCDRPRCLVSHIRCEARKYPGIFVRLLVGETQVYRAGRDSLRQTGRILAVIAVFGVTPLNPSGGAVSPEWETASQRRGRPGIVWEALELRSF